MLSFLPLSGGAFMGWALGANDTANVFGTAVGSRILSFRQAAFLCSVMVTLGAYFQGVAGMHTYRDLANYDSNTLLITSFAAAIAVTIMTLRSLPISASQSMVGAITGIGLANQSVNWLGLAKILFCWVATPVGAMVIAILVHRLLLKFFLSTPMSILRRDQIIWGGLILFGCYGAYALGANNVANVTGIYSGHFEQMGITDRHLALFGGLTISLGTITFSKRVMRTVGSTLFRLDGFASLVAVLSMAITVHTFAFIGVPVSTSHAIVGAVCGLALLSEGTEFNVRKLKEISFAWLSTPIFAMILASSMHAIFLS